MFQGIKPLSELHLGISNGLLWTDPDEAGPRYGCETKAWEASLLRTDPDEAGPRCGCENKAWEASVGRADTFGESWRHLPSPHPWGGSLDLTPPLMLTWPLFPCAG